MRAPSHAKLDEPDELPAERMSRAELRAGVSLAAVFGLRMLGLFLVLPVFSVYARSLPGGDDLLWTGIALGIFALVQASLQIPLGRASDRFGRKPVIVGGLLVFALGCLMAAWAPTIEWMVAARALQGLGAISAAVSALAADLTREQHRSKVMAIIGASIGVVFALSMVLAPALYSAIGMAGIFVLIALLSLLAIWLVLRGVPDPAQPVPAKPLPMRVVLADRQLWQLDFGVFVLHMVQLAMFLVLPRVLVDLHGMAVTAHWQIYLPVVLASFALMAPVIVYAERRHRVKQVFLIAVALMVLSQLILIGGSGDFWPLATALLLFFVAFNILEATMPALVSRLAPPQARGLALGVFNTSQTLGSAAGGILGGALAMQAGAEAVFAAAAILLVIWFLWAWRLQVPPVSAQKVYTLAPHLDLDAAQAEIVGLPGVREVVLERVRRVAVLKVNPERWDEQRMLRFTGGEA